MLYQTFLMSDLLYGIFNIFHILHAYAFAYTAQLSKVWVKGEELSPPLRGQSSRYCRAPRHDRHVFLGRCRSRVQDSLLLLPEYPSQCTFPIAWDSPGAWQVPGGHVGFLGCPGRRRGEPGEGTAGGACHLNYGGSLSEVVETRSNRVSSEHLLNYWGREAFTL